MAAGTPFVYQGVLWSDCTKLETMAEDDFRESQHIVIAFIHNIERSHSFNYSIPNDLYELCLLFYHIHYLPLTDDDILPTPFTILFAIYGMSQLLNKRGWTSMNIEDQFQYLQHTKINSDYGRQQVINELCNKEQHFSDFKHNEKNQNKVKYALQQFYETSQSLLTDNTNIEMWSDYHMIISLIHHGITNPEQHQAFGFSSHSRAIKQKVYSSIWSFLNYFRRYMHETKYTGTDLNIDIDPLLIGKCGYGFRIVKRICRVYNQKGWQYTKCKRQLSHWVRQIDDRDLPKKPRHIVYEMIGSHREAFPYNVFDKSVLLSILRPVIDDIEVIGVFKCKDKFSTRYPVPGIGILIHHNEMNKSYTDFGKMLHESLANSIGSEHCKRTRMIRVGKCDVNSFLMDVVKQHDAFSKFDYSFWTNLDDSETICSQVE